MHEAMRGAILAAAFMGLAVTSASAQSVVNLTGTYRCVQGCAPGFEGRAAFVTQNGWDVNVVTESGVTARGWPDWFGPTSRIWVEQLQQSAVFSPDGTTIQFDGGRLWYRVDEAQAQAVAYCARRYRSYDPGSQTYLGRNGVRRSCP